MERREALRYTAMAMGMGLSAGTLASMLAGCTVDTSPDWRPVFFTRDELDFIRALADTMLPKTETPGAKEALVDRYLDTIRPLRYTEEENLAFREQLTVLIKQANLDIGKKLHRAKPKQRLDWLTEIDTSAYTAIKENPDLPASERPFYLSLKEQILGAYFNSEAVGKAYFAYDPIPGRYDPCIPYAEVGKMWSSGS